MWLHEWNWAQQWPFCVIPHLWIGDFASQAPNGRQSLISLDDPTHSSLRQSLLMVTSTIPSSDMNFVTIWKVQTCFFLFFIFWAFLLSFVSSSMGSVGDTINNWKCVKLKHIFKKLKKVEQWCFKWYSLYFWLL